MSATGTDTTKSMGNDRAGGVPHGLYDALAFGVAWAVHVVLVLRFRFVCDDAFISFRYARNWARGHGLRYNPGTDPPVEGYSNLLWVALGSALETLRLDMVFWLPVLSAACGSLLLLLVYAALRSRMRVTPLVAGIATLGLASAPPFAVWSTGGLATMPHAVLVFGAWLLVTAGKNSPARVLAAALLGIALTLIRVEGIAWVGVVAVCGWITRRMDERRGTALILSFAVAAGLTFAAYLAWRWSYYGQLVSNTAHAKVHVSTETLVRGGKYVGLFLLTYLAPLLLVPAAGLALVPKWRSAIVPALGFVLASFGYAIVASGDFMTSFRLLAVSLPFQALGLGALAAWALERWPSARTAVLAAAAMLVLVAAIPGWNLHVIPESIRAGLAFRDKSAQFHSEWERWRIMVENSERWRRKGLGLASFAPPDASIVERAIGNVGWYSKLTIFDQHGLVTSEVATRDVRGALRSPGHDKLVPRTFFLDRRPTILRALVVDGSAAAERVRARWSDESPEGYSIEVVELAPSASATPAARSFLVAESLRGTPLEARGGPARPNLLLVVWDTVRADRLGLYGHSVPTTPTLDGLAADGLVFERAISPAIWTLPSHASLFSGLAPSEHGATAAYKWVDDAHVLLAEILRDDGYATWAFSANPFVSSDFNLLQGFAEVAHPWQPAWEAQARRATLDKLIPGDRSTELSPEWTPGPLRQGRSRDAVKDAGPVAARALDSWLSRKRTGEPFFAFVNLMEAHVPRIPASNTRLAVMDESTYLHSLEVDQSFIEMMLYNFGKSDYDAAALDAIRAVYDAAILEADRATAELLGVLESRGLEGDTIVVVTSDHGESLGEHGLLGHKYSVYDTLLRVPLVIRQPGRIAPGRVPETVSMLGLRNALLDLMGVPHGGSGWPSLLSSEGRSRPVPAELAAAQPRALRRVSRLYDDLDPAPWLRTFDAVEWHGYKYIRASDGSDALYRVEVDPAELRDLSDRDPDRSAALAARLDAWHRQRALFEPARAAPPEPAAETREHLRALGYLEDGS